MSRIIKFRAWDKVMDYMDYDALDYAPDFLYELFHSDHYDLMQYIGFTDTKQKEIYEDDIVHVIDTHAPQGSGISNFIGIVKYNCGSFYISDLDGTYSNYRLMDLEIEVIGNIFEDKEMMERIKLLEESEDND